MSDLLYLVALLVLGGGALSFWVWARRNRQRLK